MAFVSCPKRISKPLDISWASTDQQLLYDSVTVLYIIYGVAAYLYHHDWSCECNADTFWLTYAYHPFRFAIRFPRQLADIAIFATLLELGSILPTALNNERSQPLTLQGYALPRLFTVLGSVVFTALSISVLSVSEAMVSSRYKLYHSVPSSPEDYLREQRQHEQLSTATLNLISLASIVMCIYSLGVLVFSTITYVRGKHQMTITKVSPISPSSRFLHI